MAASVPHSSSLGRAASRVDAPLTATLLLTCVYAAGLTQRIDQPWTGMHDWNGAFFSQLARNCLRYPWELHHGIPVVAMGDAVPPADERSFYATHPPGLVWLVAGAFRLLGEHEWAARLVPILASLGSLGLLVGLVREARGPQTALLTGLVYALLPMAVYFGRMVDHEAVCLFAMLAALRCWQALHRVRRPRRRSGLWLAMSAALALGIWTDWPVVLFAALLTAYGLGGAVRRRTPCGLAVGTALISAVAVGGMAAYLVRFGLDNRWENLRDIFLSRTSTLAEDPARSDISARGGPAVFTRDNLTWAVIAFGSIGALIAARRAFARPRSAATDPPAASAQELADRRAPDVMALLALVGLLWLAVFWRQYERHNYWLFYLGPAVAWLAAEGILATGGALARILPESPGRLAAAAALVVAGFSLIKTNDYFSRESYSPLVVGVWKQLNMMTQPTDRIGLYVDPIVVERRGSYVFRNIVPPHMAFYLDRRHSVCRDLTSVPGLERDHALFLMPVQAAEAYEGEPEMQRLHARYRLHIRPAFIWFDLRTAAPTR